MDLRSIVTFIRSDSPSRAESFGYRLILEAEKLRSFPRRGRVVPEFRDEAIREIIVRPYRIIYRVSEERRALEIIRVWHGARGEPDLTGLSG